MLVGALFLEETRQQYLGSKTIAQNAVVIDSPSVAIFFVFVFVSFRAGKALEYGTRPD